VVLFNAFATQCVLAVQNAIFFQNALDEERIKNELASAHAIQASLLPEINVRRGRLRVAAKSISAREVGGEFYDIFYFDDNSVAIALGDLHRKGMPGALYASIASGVVKALSRLRGDNPALILRRVHETLKDHLDSSVYLSLFYGMVRGDARSLQFANAGVAYPILVRGGVSRYLRFAGNFEEKSPKNIRVELQLGDFFVIITDGVINLKNRRGQLLGLNRVMKEIESGMATPEDIIQALLQLMDEFTDGLERREDISIIAFKAE
jgi:sigma-B regulation protein RsbU (phosphoserine phosphatase)